MALRWKRCGLILSALLACVLLGCSGSGGVPVITAFSAGSTTVDAGGTVELDWTVSGASSLAIDNGVGTVTGRSSLRVTPSQTTTYTLTASNAKGSVSAKTTITVKVTLSLEQTALVLTPGSTQRFSATVKGSSAGVAWSVLESGGGWITADGVYIAPSTAGIYHVQATSQADATVYARAAITVDSIGVSVLPGSASLAPRGSLTLTATISGASTNSGVTWSVLGNGAGTLVDKGNGTALYTAPGTAGTYQVQAASLEDPTKTATVVLTVNQVAVVVSPVSQRVLAGASQPYTATVTGSSNTAVTWSVVETEGGSISSSGLYTAPTIAGTYHIQATSVADASASATVPVMVELVGVSISPAQATLAPGAPQQFAALVAGTENTQVTWQVQEAGGGQIDSSGSYTAPSVTGTYHVSAYSVEDPGKSSTATVSVPSRTLTVALGTDASGTPSASTSAVHGQVISYSYAAASGYNLQVLVDGATAPAAGTLIMDRDHSISVSTSLAVVVTAFYQLATTVSGAVGAPIAGSAGYAQGTVVAYSYALQSGYIEPLVVTLDGTVIPASGTITMNGNHTLSAVAHQEVVVVPILTTRTLTVNLGSGTSGIPAATTTCNDGTAVTYVYALTTSAPSGYVLSVLVDDVAAAATGTLTMKADHTITVAAVVLPFSVSIDGVAPVNPNTPDNLGDSYNAGETKTYLARPSGGIPPYTYKWESLNTNPYVVRSTNQYLTLPNMQSDTTPYSWRLTVTDTRGKKTDEFFWLAMN